MDISDAMATVLGPGVSRPAHARHHVRVDLQRGHLQVEDGGQTAPFVIGMVAKSLEDIGGDGEDTLKWLPLVVGRAAKVLA
jgi:hypothetical protein